MAGYLSRFFMEMMSRSMHIQGVNLGDEDLRRLTGA